MVQVLDDGTVAVSYYDFRNNTSDSGATTPTDAFVVHCHASCASAGSWGDETRVTDASFDSRKAPVARGFFLGDYEGLGSTGSALFRSSPDPRHRPCQHLRPGTQPHHPVGDACDPWRSLALVWDLPTASLHQRHSAGRSSIELIIGPVRATTTIWCWLDLLTAVNGGSSC